MASIAADMFVGRERFATLLMMRLIETVILWLSDDQSFWEEIEEGPKPLGPLGLRQVGYLLLISLRLFYSIYSLLISRASLIYHFLCSFIWICNL